MKTVLACLFFFCLTMPAFSLTFGGVVLDDETLEPVYGALVTVKGTKVGVVTDNAGKFLFNYAGNNTAVLEVSYTGYTTQEFSFSKDSIGLRVRLRTNENALKEARITDVRVTQKQKQAPLTVESLDGTGIKETPAANFYEGLLLVLNGTTEASLPVNLNGLAQGVYLVKVYTANSTGTTRVVVE